MHPMSHGRVNGVSMGLSLTDPLEPLVNRSRRRGGNERGRNNQHNNQPLRRCASDNCHYMLQQIHYRSNHRISGTATYRLEIHCSHNYRTLA